jgi:hypothetical protein
MVHRIICGGRLYGCQARLLPESPASSPGLAPVEVEKHLGGGGGEVIVRRSRVGHLSGFPEKHRQDLPLVQAGEVWKVSRRCRAASVTRK